MCIGVPMRIVACDGATAIAERGGARSTIDIARLGDVAPGLWVLAFEGIAVRAISADEAAQTDDALAALSAALDGAPDVERFFADLVGREPQLPDHLKAADK